MATCVDSSTASYAKLTDLRGLKWENQVTNLHQAVAIALLTLIANAAVATEPLRLRILSYNIHHAEGVDGKLDVPRIADVIQSVEPDLVALQEVDKKVQRTQSVDQPAELARLTKMHVAFGANIELQGGHYGNAVLSKFPIVRHENHQLPNIDAGEQRGVIEAEINVSETSPPFLLYATHLDYRADDRERLASAQKINERAARHSDRPALLAGDLNDTSDSKTLERLASHWTRANVQPLATTPVDQPTRQIDFVLFRPQQSWKVIDVKVLDEAVASDHRAIFAVLELVPGK
ncbi:MAG: endonuclease/exonuclease/phosphatase family protein [Planctomycetia bacterium]|nr:endonuclease/exonuclease/phosphatase family protein [Planctomycetia bacterium]